ncbi:MAG: DUF7742 family protein, partial [Paracoccaceae bacterium]
AARVLLRLPEKVRSEVCVRLFTEADAADRFVAANGRLHPDWGNGSLMSAARKRMLAPERGFDDHDYCGCFELVLQKLTDWRLSQKRR